MANRTRQLLIAAIFGGLFGTGSGFAGFVSPGQPDPGREPAADAAFVGGAVSSDPFRHALPVTRAPHVENGGVSPIESEEPRAAVRAPSPPSSLEISLSVFATLGAYQLSRSMRKAGWSTLPEWYHTGGPQQIGYATPFDLEHSDQLVACDFVTIVETPKSAALLQPGGDCWSPPRHFLRPHAARGPPHCG